MKLIQPYCLLSLSPADIDFILSVLGDDLENEEALIQLLMDESSRDLILDDDDLFHAILETPDQLQISLTLYFYILLRHTLKQRGLDDRELADYVASVLAQFATQMPKLRQNPREPFFYAVDIVEEIEQANSHRRFFLITWLGNMSLVFTGVFPDLIEYRALTKAAPTLNYYESIGSAQFQAASDHNLAQTYHLDRVYATLSNSFGTVRTALNGMKERLLFLGNSQPV